MFDKPEIQAVAFDMDGLMFNTEELYNQVGKIALERRGKVFSNDLKLKMMGRHAADAMKILIQETGISSSAEELLEETDQLINEIFPKQIEMMPGLESLLLILEDLGIPKAVTTSSREKNVEFGFNKFDFHDRFHFVLCAESTNKSKPNPEIYLNAAKCFEVEPEAMLVLEDSPLGVQAGVASGAITVAVPTKYTISHDFPGATLIASGLNDPKLLELF